MPAFGPIKRRDLIAALRRAGWSGPYPGAKHEYMLKGDHAITIPNPHGSEISKDLLKQLLNQAKIMRAEWERL